ncbi:50S ribosomal protein L11 methyltransferase [Agarilytica rhodophyticola]|uniref:50S ribosomal protein L11 methyltransferase n=1 Tax=Agarilytica rhodophyticola TaxID=1737490 RepID=UPI000B347D00|nr:50S ribosomal protein L11 methyltransferase [Agarilytica rhodophyticola]
MPWLQLRVNTQRDDVPSVETAMTSNGALSVTFEDNADQPIFEPELGETPLWNETCVTGLFDAAIETHDVQDKITHQCGVGDDACHWQILEDKDWQREWMKHFSPLQCSANFWICPSWIAPPKPEAINLMLDPGLAFGTGTHPTTFMCLKWVAECNISNKDVVDYGCGSGILGIAALLHGAKSVTGIDIDPQALIASQENAKRNNLDKELFPVYFPDKCPTEKTDIVLANILAGPLVELAPALVSLLKTGGKICLSGILKSQQQAIIDTYSHHVTIDKIDEKDEWVCIVGTKKA